MTVHSEAQQGNPGLQNTAHIIRMHDCKAVDKQA